MILAERHMIKRSDKNYKELDNLCFLSKNLYNAALYKTRQEYINNKKYNGWVNNINDMTREDNIDYRQLPAQVSQQVIKQVDQNFKSFFKLLKLKLKGKYDKKVNIPGYLDKFGRNILVYTNQCISKTELKKGYIKLSKSNVKIKTNVTDIKQVRIVHSGTHITVEVIYDRPNSKQVENENYAAIDLGLSNLATVSGNSINPFIINGRPLKSINHFYNKKLAKLKSRQDISGNKNVCKSKIRNLHLKRNNKINDYLHKSSKLLVNQLVSNQISTLIIGHNKEWKQDINIGKVNNQNFVSIPHSRFIHMITYKASLNGITVKVQEESYTSKCSFFDDEDICKHKSYKGSRIKRGLFKTSSGLLVNADLNGSLNILKKAIPNAFRYGIKVCSTPVVLTTKQ